jgi:hypothetical protein
MDRYEIIKDILNEQYEGKGEFKRTGWAAKTENSMLCMDDYIEKYLGDSEERYAVLKFLGKLKDDTGRDKPLFINRPVVYGFDELTWEGVEIDPLNFCMQYGFDFKDGKLTDSPTRSKEQTNAQEDLTCQYIGDLYKKKYPDKFRKISKLREYSTSRPAVSTEDIELDALVFDEAGDKTWWGRFVDWLYTSIPFLYKKREKKRLEEVRKKREEERQRVSEEWDLMAKLWE